MFDFGFAYVALPTPTPAWCRIDFAEGWSAFFYCLPQHRWIPADMRGVWVHDVGQTIARVVGGRA